MRMGDSFSRLTMTLESATVLADSNLRSAASIMIGSSCLVMDWLYASITSISG